MSVDVGTAQGHLDLDISGFLSGLKTAQSQAQTTLKNVEQRAGTSLTGIGKKMSGVGDMMTLGITTPLLGIATAGMKVATDFEYAMSQVQAISGATGDEFDSLREEAIQLGADTAFSSTEVADAMTEMAKAGWSSQQILDGMEGVLDAAAASGTGLATTSTIMADAISGFGLEASDATRVADLLTQAANAGTIGIEDLGESFKYIAPVASTMGFSIEDVTTALTAMSKAGIKGGQAGTSLRGVLTRMVKPTDDVAAAMDELGITLTNQDGTFKSLDQIIGELRTSFDGMTDSQKTYYASVLAGTEGQSGLLALLNMSQEEYDEVAASMNNAAGVADKTAAVMQDNLKSKIEQLVGSLESLAIKIADLVIPALSDLVDKATEVVNWFTNLDEGTQKSILKFLAFAAAIGPTLSIVGRFASGIGGLLKFIGGIPGKLTAATVAFTKLSNGLKNIPEAITLARAGFPNFAKEASVLGAAIGGITAPIAAVIAATVALYAAFATLWTTNEDFRNSITSTWQGIVDSFNSFTQGIVDRLNALGFSFKSITDVIWTVWNGFCQLLAPVFEGAFNYIANNLNTVFGVITGILDVFIGLFTGNWDQLWQGVKEIFGSIWDGIVSNIMNIFNTITGVLDTALSFVGTSIEDVWNSIVDFFVTLPENISDALSGLWDSIVTFFSDLVDQASTSGQQFLDSVVEFFSQLPYNVGYFLGFTIASVAAWVVQMAQSAVDAGSQFISNVVNFFTQLPGNIATWLTTTVSNAILWVQAMASYATVAGRQFVANVVSFMQSLPGRIASFLSSAVSQAASFVSNFASKAVQAASRFVSSIVNGLASLPSRVASIGAQVVQGIWSGISGAAGWLYDQVAGFVGGIVDGAKAALGIKSPSRVMRDEVGKFLPPGIAIGFSKAMPAAVGSMQKDIDNGINKLSDDTPDVEVKANGRVNLDAVVSSLRGYYSDVLDWFRSISDGVDESINSMIDKLAMFSEFGSGFTVNADGTVSAAVFGGGDSKQRRSRVREDGNNKQDGKGDGDTFIFYSPKPIDEIEAARQMRRQKRKLVEGI